MMSSLPELQSLLELVRDWTHQNVSAADVDDAEQIALAVGRAVSATVAEEATSALGEQNSYEGCSLACDCSYRAPFKGYRRRDIVTLAGAVRVKRAYYHCGHCGTGYTPWDRRQGLNGRVWSSGVKALVAELDGRLTYSEVSRVLEITLGLRLEESSAEIIAAEVGERIREAEAERMAGIASGEITPLVGKVPRRMYVSIDGTYAHVDGSWHEVKTAAVYDTAPDKEGIDTPIATRYVGAQEGCEQFGWRVYAAAVESGVESVPEVVVSGDGAEWIWNVFGEHYPQATQIVDYWHACEHIHDLAKTLHGEGNANGQRWGRDHCEALRERGPTTLLRALRRARPTTPEQAEAVRLATGYFERNWARMDYPAFRARGLMIGSGPVEAACKVLVGQRLKRSGMRWKRPGADAVLAIRALVLSERYDELRRLSRAA